MVSSKQLYDRIVKANRTAVSAAEELYRRLVEVDKQVADLITDLSAEPGRLRGLRDVLGVIEKPSPPPTLRRSWAEDLKAVASNRDRLMRGLTDKALAKELGIPTYRIIKCRKKLGIPGLGPSWRSDLEPPNPKILAATFLKKQGKTHRETAEILQVSKSYVSMLLRMAKYRVPELFEEKK